MIHLITDSTFGIPKEYAEKNDIKIVNLKLILDEKVTDEGFQDTWDEFYSRYKTSKNFPTTSQPSPEDFISAIKEVIEEDSNAEIIILTLSSALSGTINAATIAVSEFKSRKIVAIDTAQACVCGRLLTEELVELIKIGKTFDEIVSEIIPTLKEKLDIHFIPATMDALKRGGRIGKLSATLASVLKIKPLFSFKNGLITIKKKVLGIGRAISEMIHELPKKLKKLYICYICNDDLVPEIQQKLDKEKIAYNEIVPVGPVFGAHVGMGAIGLASLEE